MVEEMHHRHQIQGSMQHFDGHTMAAPILDYTTATQWDTRMKVRVQGVQWAHPLVRMDSDLGLG